LKNFNTDENDLICCSWEHSKERNIQSIYLFSAFYSTQRDQKTLILPIPVAFQTIKKTIRFYDNKTKKEKLASPIFKNELM